jgi:hypothetical protein
MHIIVVPRLMTGRWRKHLSRGTDGYVKLEDKQVWDLSQHCYEPVVIFLCLPFVSSNPKLQERGRLLDRFRRTVLEQQLPQVSSMRRRDILRQLFMQRAATLPRVRVRAADRVLNRWELETSPFGKNSMKTANCWKKKMRKCVSKRLERATI